MPTLQVPATYSTIQAAINAATAGDTINVAAGTYNEQISIGKALTLTGPNADIAGNGTRVAEAILLNKKITISSSSVVINGFRINHTLETALSLIYVETTGISTIKNCYFDRQGSTTGGVTAIGIEVVIGSDGPLYIQENYFTGNDISGLFGSHKTWNSGVYVNGRDRTVTISGNTFTNCRTALNLDDLNSNITVSGNSFSNCGTYMSVGGSTVPSGSYAFGANNFTDVGTIFNLSNVATTFRLDITSSTLNGAPFTGLTLSQLYSLEARIYHRGRSSKNGVVTYVANNQYVVQGGTTIQRTITDAAIGDTINVNAGTYTENVTVSKRVTLNGAGTSTDISGQVTITGSGLDASNRLVVSNVKVRRGITLSSASAGSYYTINAVDISGATANGIDISGAALTDVKVYSSTLSYNGAAGLRVASAVTSLDVSGCTIQNNVNGVSIVSGQSAAGITVRNNRLLSNSNKAILHAGTGTLSAPRNWWGTSTVADIISAISGDVTYVPFIAGESSNSVTVDSSNKVIIDASTITTADAGAAAVNSSFSAAAAVPDGSAADAATAVAKAANELAETNPDAYAAMIATMQEEIGGTEIVLSEAEITELFGDAVVPTVVTFTVANPDNTVKIPSNPDSGLYVQLVPGTPYTISEPYGTASVTCVYSKIDDVKTLTVTDQAGNISYLYAGDTLIVGNRSIPIVRLDSMLTYSGSNVACFTTGMRILTPTGYRAVETLRKGDLVMTADGREAPIKVYSSHLKTTTAATAPYVVPAHSFGRNVPPAELRLSPLHAFQTKKNIWQLPKYANNAKVVQYGVGEPVTYYHLECPNFFRDNLVVEGCVVESFGAKQTAGIKTIYTPNTRLGGYTRITGPTAAAVHTSR